MSDSKELRQHILKKYRQSFVFLGVSCYLCIK